MILNIIDNRNARIAGRVFTRLSKLHGMTTMLLMPTKLIGLMTKSMCFLKSGI